MGELIFDTKDGSFEGRFVDETTERYFVLWSAGMIPDKAFEELFDVEVPEDGVWLITFRKWWSEQKPVGEELAVSEQTPVQVTKEKKYLKPGEEPPEGKEVKTGPRGGRYYESEPYWSEGAGEGEGGGVWEDSEMLPPEVMQRFRRPTTVEDIPSVENWLVEVIEGKRSADDGYGGAQPGDRMAVNHIFQRGKMYPWKPFPEDMYRRGEIGDCFANATHLAHEYPELTYVEGYATGGTHGWPPIPTFHAWCIDKDGNVVDSTWPDTSGETRQYYGVAIPTPVLIKIILASKFYGVFGEKSWHVARKILEASFQKEKIYLREGEQPPQGRTVQTGPRGGRFFEGTREEREAHDQGGERTANVEEIWTQREQTGAQEEVNPSDPVNVEGVKTQMINDLREALSTRLQFIPTSGPLGPQTIPTIEKNVMKTITSANKYLAGDTVDLMHKFLNIGRRLLSMNEGIESEVVNEMVMDSAFKLLFQEIESNRQQFTDHGIRHIVKNIEMQDVMLNELEKAGMQISPRDRMMAYFIMANHDMGYTASAVRQGGKEGIKASGSHQKYSADIMREQKEIWDVNRLFSEEEFDRICKIIETHDSTSLDMTDPVAFTTRIADNLSLFHVEKLPSMFKYVEGSVELLKKMGEASQRGNEQDFAKHVAELNTLVDNSRLSEPLKRDLKMGVREINMMTPKFTMGTLAGEVKDIGSTQDSVMAVTINFNEFDAFLQQYFDMGQGQLKRLLKAYGITEFNKSEYALGQKDGKTILKITVGNARNISFSKERVYLRQGEQPPQGKTVQTGPRGGKYYESDGQQPSSAGSPVVEESTIAPEQMTESDFVKYTGVEVGVGISYEGEKAVVGRSWSNSVRILTENGKDLTLNYGDFIDKMHDGSIGVLGEPDWSGLTITDYTIAEQIAKEFIYSERCEQAWKDAVKGYCNWSFDEMNNVLRGTLSEPTGYASSYLDEIREKIETMKEWMSAMPKFKGMTFRGMALPDGFLEELVKAHNEKTTIVFPAFMSTSRSRNNAMKFIPTTMSGALFRIVGKSGVPVDGLGKWEEREIIYPPGMKFKIKKMEWVEVNYRKVLVVTMEEAE